MSVWTLSNSSTIAKMSWRCIFCSLLVFSLLAAGPSPALPSSELCEHSVSPDTHSWMIRTSLEVSSTRLRWVSARRRTGKTDQAASSRPRLSVKGWAGCRGSCACCDAISKESRRQN